MKKRYLACKHIIKAYLDGADNSRLQEIADSFIQFENIYTIFYLNSGLVKNFFANNIDIKTPC